MPFKTSFWVRFGDTDPFGVVYFVSFFRYAHQVLEDFFRAQGIEPLELFRNPDRNLGLPVVAAGGEFKKPLKYGEEVEARVYMASKGNSSITFRVEFWQKEEFSGSVDLVLVAIDRAWRPRRLPPELEALEVED
ncbi:MAG: hypothetical protein DRI91_03595 [Aquificota bacterium]|nr:MAG: hypothetical protein DRI91_03595 [Aquificota bacterium]